MPTWRQLLQMHCPLRQDLFLSINLGMKMRGMMKIKNKVITVISIMLPIWGVRACLRPGTYHVLVLTELQWICGTGAQGDGSLLNALSRKCYMHTLQYVHRGTLP